MKAGRYLRAVLRIQAHVRGWLTRLRLARSDVQQIQLGLDYLESRLKRNSTVTHQVVTLQRHIRGFLQRRRYKELLIEKLLKDQEDLFETQFRKVEAGLLSDRALVSPTFSRVDPVRCSLQERRLAPQPDSEPRNKSATHSPAPKHWRHVEFSFDVYIVASTQIQRHYRGYRVRKALGGSFRHLRRKVVLMQRWFRQCRGLRESQLSAAARLLAEEARILTSSFRSYQHLRAHLLTHDLRGAFATHVARVDHAVKSTGLYADSQLQRGLEGRVQELESTHTALLDTLARLKTKLSAAKAKALNWYLRALKTIKCQVELSFKSNLEQLSSLTRSVLRDREPS